MLADVEGADVVTSYLAALEVPAQPRGTGEWWLTVEAAGHPLRVELTRRGELLRASAAVLPGDLIDPHQLLHWNTQAPFVCFAENRAGEVVVCGEIPLVSLDPELLDRFLGLLVAAATRARQFVIG